MTYVRKPTDRFVVELDSCQFTFRPLSVSESMEFEPVLTNPETPQREKVKATLEVIRKVLVGASGLKNVDGSEWQPEFKDGCVTPESLDIILTINNVSNLMLFGTTINKIAPVEGQVLNPITGKPIPGITLKKIISG